MSDDDLLNDFVAESREHLADIEGRFLELEEQGEAVDPELINLVFRAVHSVKGGAGFLGFENIQRLAHVMENLLDRIRQGQIGVDHAKVDALLRGADHLKALIDDITHSNAMDIAAPMAAIEAHLATPSTCPDASAGSASQPAPAERSLASDLQPEPAVRQRLAQSPEHLYHIAYDLRRQEEQLGRDPLAALEELDRTGEIVASAIRPAAVGDLRAGLPSGPLICELVYATVFDPTIVAEALEIPTEAVRPVRATAAALVFAVADDEDAASPASAFEPTAAPTSEKTPAMTAIQEPTRRLSGSFKTQRGETIRLPIERIDRLMAQAGEL
ncbi:MAG: Hpt domain-containing protein, partial [Planctomycetota bacterium]